MESGVTKKEFKVIFMGNHDKQIDAKSRVGIPAKFRKKLKKSEWGNVWLVRGLEPQSKYLEVWPEKTWEQMCEQVASLPNAVDRRKMMRGYVSRATECKLDSQGRLIIPQNYKDFAKIQIDVTWIGNTNHLELWAKEESEAVYNAQQNDAFRSWSDNADHFTG